MGHGQVGVEHDDVAGIRSPSAVCTATARAPRSSTRVTVVP